MPLAARPLRQALLAALALSGAAAAQTPPPIGDLQFLPGDLAAGTAAESQLCPEIAAGGPGYLAVWQDMRPVLCGTTSTPYEPFCGNGWDIYGARFDVEGNLLDESPILIAQEGMNQERPRVAWNGENWLVVYSSQRPDWYFFEDVVGRRVSAAGVVLDEEPIPIRLDCTNCTPAAAPGVGSDGSNWLVAWEGLQYVGEIPYPNLEGVRVGPAGNVLGTPVTLQLHGVAAFGPRQPQVVWAGDEYMLLWTESVPEEVRFKRFTADLAPLDASPRHVANAGGGRVATDGEGFFVVTGARRGYRVNHAGTVLDPGGIGFDAGIGAFQPSGPQVAWDGFDWTIAFSENPDFDSSAEVYMVRVSSQGAVVEGPTPVVATPAEDYQPALASADAGRVEVAWAPWGFAQGEEENIRVANVADLDAIPDLVDGSVGLHRQGWVRLATNGGEHLAALTSEGGGATRILVQRLALDGTPLGAEPFLLATYSELTRVFPDVAFDGERYLVSWVLAGTIWGQRVAADGAPIDAAPVALLAGENASAVAVGGLDGTFLLAYTWVFSGDQQLISGVRVRGEDLAVLDAPFDLGFDFALAPRVAAFGGRWLALWERQPSHDISDSVIRAAFVAADGVPTSDFVVSQQGNGDDAAVAVAGEEALVVWHDNADFNEASIEGRILTADGGFATPEFTIADEPEDQFYPAAAWSGAEYAVAWMDFRSLPGIEQRRGDIWTARVDAEGTVLDPGGGFQLTEGPLPDRPAMAGGDGKAIVAFTQLHGVAGPEVQRIAYRVLGIEGTMLFADGFESGDLSAWDAVSE